MKHFLIALAVFAIPTTGLAAPPTPVVPDTTRQELVAAPETSNPYATTLLWTGVAVITGGIACGVVSQVEYYEQLNDGSVRSAAINQDLFDTANTLATAGDVGLITGASLVGLATILWATGFGDTAHEPDPDQLAIGGLVLPGGFVASIGATF